jgi:hypothetical protein
MLRIKQVSTEQKRSKYLELFVDQATPGFELGKKDSMRRRESSINRSILASFFL